MNEKEFARLQGRLVGLREATKLIEKSEDGDIDFITFQLLEKIEQLKTQLSGVTVHDEVAELKARIKELEGKARGIVKWISTQLPIPDQVDTELEYQNACHGYVECAEKINLEFNLGEWDGCILNNNTASYNYSIISNWIYKQKITMTNNKSN